MGRWSPSRKVSLVGVEGAAPWAQKGVASSEQVSWGVGLGEGQTKADTPQVPAETFSSPEFAESEGNQP